MKRIYRMPQQTTHFHWALMPPIQLTSEQVTARCGTVVPARQITHKRNECTCEECSRILAAQFLFLRDRE